MSWIIIATILLVLVGVAEKSGRKTPTRIRGSRIYQGGRSRVIGVGAALRGRQQMSRSARKAVDELAGRTAATEPPPRRRASTIAYEPPAAPPPAGGAPNGAVAGAGAGVDFFQGLLLLINAAYENPNDALRQLRTLGEGGRQWNNGLIRLHQRMADRGDMRIDPFVSDHVVRAAALGQAMVMELVEADTALTTLLNMTLAEITERGLQVPNTK